MLEMMIIFAFFIFYALFGQIFVTLLMSLFSRSKVKKSDHYKPRVSLMIAAYNEENNIEEKILNSLKLDYPRELLRIVVVSDGSTDDTDSIVESYASEGVHLVRVEGRVGKTEARNVAVLKEKSEIIVFSDATAIYEVDAISKLVRNFNDPTVGMVSGNLSYRDQKNGRMGFATKLFWKYENLIKNAQSKLKTLTGAVGCIHAFRRELFYRLPANIIEDFTGPLMIIANNHRVVFEREAIAYERTTSTPSQEFKMRVRVIRGGMKGFLFALPKLKEAKKFGAIFQLLSHKMMRWLMPFFMFGFYLSNLLVLLENEHVIFQFTFAVQAFAYLLALLGLLDIKVKGMNPFINFATYFVVTNAASAVALFKTLTEDLEATWETNVY
ncbi:MAG: glycosyltransferase family 2 protein [Bacteriovoracaceae bacterium]